MKINVALIAGGFTEEAEVSFKSAAFVYSQLDQSKYNVYPVTIIKDDWFYVDEYGIKYHVDKANFSIPLQDHSITFDVAFIIVHGIPGEDGHLQSYLDLIGIPYTSCDALTSAITMNKAYTKAVLYGISDLHLAKSVFFFDSQRDQAVDLVKQQLHQYPLFVKPNAGGSSIGMTKVKTEDELPAAIQKAFDAADTGAQVIVEEFVSGREFSQGIYRNSKGELVVLPATEVKTTREFFDYEAKYIPGLTEEITPADQTEIQRETISRILKDVYLRLNAKGMVRIDYFLENGSGLFYFIEINTIPGQTAQSFIPQQVRAAGMTEKDFYSELIDAVAFPLKK